MSIRQRVAFVCCATFTVFGTRFETSFSDNEAAGVSLESNNLPVARAAPQRTGRLRSRVGRFEPKHQKGTVLAQQEENSNDAQDSKTESGWYGGRDFVRSSPRYGGEYLNQGYVHDRADFRRDFDDQVTYRRSSPRVERYSRHGWTAFDGPGGDRDGSWSYGRGYDARDGGYDHIDGRYRGVRYQRQQADVIQGTTGTIYETHDSDQPYPTSGHFGASVRSYDRGETGYGSGWHDAVGTRGYNDFGYGNRWAGYGDWGVDRGGYESFPGRYDTRYDGTYRHEGVYHGDIASSRGSDDFYNGHHGGMRAGYGMYDRANVGVRTTNYDVYESPRGYDWHDDNFRDDGAFSAGFRSS